MSRRGNTRRIRRSPEAALHHSWPAVAETTTVARRAVVDFAEQAGATSEELEAVQLAVSEAVTNAVMHAYRDRDPGLVHVSAALAGDELWVLVADDGCGLSPRDDSPGAGYGLRLIAQAADQLTVVRRGDGGTELRMRFDLEHAGRDAGSSPEISTQERRSAAGAC